MTQGKYFYIGMALGIALLGAIGYFIYKDLWAPEGAGDTMGATTTPPAFSEVPNISHVEEVPNVPDPRLDDFTYEPQSYLPDEIKKHARETVANTIAKLTENADLYSHWLELALYLKESGNFKKAEEIWLYMTKKWPSDLVAWSNLGTLYFYDLKDYPKAEVYFRKTITIDPTYVFGYKDLHDLYRFSYKQDTSAAEDILLEGLRANKDSLDLMLPLAAYYKKEGEVTKSYDLYVKALPLASAAKATSITAFIEAEITELEGKK